MKNNRPLIGTGVFVVKKGKFLLGKRKSAFGEGTRCLPGGHLEFGETFEECGIRETFEETGVNIKNVDFFGITNNIGKDKHYVTIFLKSEYQSGEPHITEFDEFYDIGWFDLEDLPLNLFPIFKEFVDNNAGKIKNTLMSN